MNVGAYDPVRALRVLQHHHVDFVVIGGFAGRLWGSPTVTNDLDICPDWGPDNLTRVATALVELHAHLRDAPADLVVPFDAALLGAGQTFTLMTDAGALDLLAAPPGGFDHASLKDAAHPLDLSGVVVDVVDLDDLIAMKRAAGRPKDRIEVEVLEAVRRETEQ